MIKQLIHDLFHISLGIIPRPISAPRLRLGPIWGSRDDTQADMEKNMYQSLYKFIMISSPNSLKSKTHTDMNKSTAWNEE